MSGLQFKLIRSPDKEYVKEFQSRIDYTDMRHGVFVESIRKMVRMREIADEADIGFAIFFQGPSGARYYISNLNH
jgi:hypothetical protein